MPSKTEVGRRIRRIRFRKGMTLKEVASASNLSATHISEIERGNASPTIGALQRIADALGERIAYIVEETNTPLAVLTTKAKRFNEYTSDAQGRVIETQRLTAHAPWGRLQIVRKFSKPGEVGDRPPASGECVILCMKGALRVTAGGSSAEIGPGDALQMRLDKGVHLETLGDEPLDALAITAYEGRRPW